MPAKRALKKEVSILETISVSSKRDLLIYLLFISIAADFNPADDAVILIAPGTAFCERTITNNNPK